MNTRIKGTGCYIPSHVETNEEFSEHEFLNADGSQFNHSNDVIIKKFSSITGIGERRYATAEYNTSDIAYFAAERAIDNARIDKETLDYIIVAHNFGDVKYGSTQGDTLPSLAARVKHKLEINNPKCVAYDLIFGCPGWLEGMIQAQAFIKAGLAKRCLVIGAETLSRVVDKYDRDSMIYSDGAGATVVEASDSESGILAHESASFTGEEAYFLFFGKSYKKDAPDTRYIKMHGRKIYEFALTQVPLAMKSCFDKTGLDISKLKKIFIHQANEKMDEAIVDRFYKLYNSETPEKVMPMNIATLGNSSVATIPTLFDMVKRGELIGHEVKKGDCIMFASVGAGMNINALVYQM